MSDNLGARRSGFGEELSGRSVGRRLGAAGLGSAVGVMALAILMICAPASANGIHPLVSYTAPFGGQTDIMSTTSTAGCGLSAIVKAPTFNLSTGVGKGIVNASSTNCAPNLNGNTGSASEQIGLSSASFTTTTGVHKLTAKWTLHWILAEKIVVPTGSGTGEAIATVSITILLWDSTTNSVVNQTSFFKQHVGFGNTTLNAPGNTTHTLSMGAATSAGDVYYIYTYAYIFAYATVSSSPGATASAKADLATGKDKANLVSYTFT